MNEWKELARELWDEKWEWLMFVLRILLAVAITVGVMLAIRHVLSQPDCPTEDSCTVDYRDGEWHIEEVTP